MATSVLVLGVSVLEKDGCKCSGGGLMMALGLWIIYSNLRFNIKRIRTDKAKTEV